jgi:hypothetical protein
VSSVGEEEDEDDASDAFDFTDEELGTGVAIDDQEAVTSAAAAAGVSQLTEVMDSVELPGSRAEANRMRKATLVDVIIAIEQNNGSLDVETEQARRSDLERMKKTLLVDMAWKSTQSIHDDK